MVMREVAQQCRKGKSDGKRARQETMASCNASATTAKRVRAIYQRRCCSSTRYAPFAGAQRRFMTPPPIVFTAFIIFIIADALPFLPDDARPLDLPMRKYGGEAPPQRQDRRRCRLRRTAEAARYAAAARAVARQRQMCARARQLRAPPRAAARTRAKNAIIFRHAVAICRQTLMR